MPSLPSPTLFEKNRRFYCFTFKASPETQGFRVMPTVAYIVQKKKDTVLLRKK